MRKVWNSEANHAQKVKQLLNKKVTEGGDMVKTKRNLASKSGAGDGTRTRDNLLGRHFLKLVFVNKFTEWFFKVFGYSSLS